MATVSLPSINNFWMMLTFITPPMYVPSVIHVFDTFKWRRKFSRNITTEIRLLKATLSLFATLSRMSHLAMVRLYNIHSFYRWSDYVFFYSRGDKIKIGSLRILYCWLMSFWCLLCWKERLLITTVVIALKYLYAEFV